MYHHLISTRRGAWYAEEIQVLAPTTPQSELNCWEIRDAPFHAHELPFRFPQRVSRDRWRISYPWPPAALLRLHQQSPPISLSFVRRLSSRCLTCVQRTGTRRTESMGTLSVATRYSYPCRFAGGTYRITSFLGVHDFEACPYGHERFVTESLRLTTHACCCATACNADQGSVVHDSG